MHAHCNRDRSVKKRKPKGMTWADAAKIVRQFSASFTLYCYYVYCTVM